MEVFLWGVLKKKNETLVFFSRAPTVGDNLIFVGTSYVVEKRFQWKQWRLWIIYSIPNTRHPVRFCYFGMCFLGREGALVSIFVLKGMNHILLFNYKWSELDVNAASTQPEPNFDYKHAFLTIASEIKTMHGTNGSSWQSIKCSLCNALIGTHSVLILTFYPVNATKGNGELDFPLCVLLGCIFCCRFSVWGLIYILLFWNMTTFWGLLG